MGIDGEIAGIFVKGSGTLRLTVAKSVGGVLGAVAAGGGRGPGPLGANDVGYISVGQDSLTLVRAKQRVLRGGFEALDETLAAVPRSRVIGSSYDKGKVMGTLEIAFDDGSSWLFEIPKAGNKGAAAAAAAIAASTLPLPPPPPPPPPPGA